MMTSSMTLGQQLRALRLLANTEQQELAAWLGISASGLSRMEVGTRPLSIERFNQARAALLPRLTEIEKAVRAGAS